MEVRLHHRDGAPILVCANAIGQAGDALALVTACVEHGTHRVLLEARQLPADFFALRTGFAGEFLQKLQNYGVRLAVVFPQDVEHGESFRAFLLEAKRGRSFRAFSERSEAEAWLASE
jgi:hypothetical protein